MSQNRSNHDVDEEARQLRVEALLQDAAQYSVEADVPANLVAEALAGGRIRCLSASRKRITYCTLAGVASVCLLIVAVRLTQRHELQMTQRHELQITFPVVPHSQTQPSGAVKVKTLQGQGQIARHDQHRVAPNYRDTSNSNPPSLTRADILPLHSQRATPFLPPKRATARAHSNPPKAIWKDEIIQTREQGILVPLVTLEPGPDSQSAELESGVAVIPVRSGVTRCEAPTPATHETKTTVSKEER